MLYLIEDYMAPEWLHLYQERYKTGGYFYRNPKRPSLHLIVKDKTRVVLSCDFGLPDIRSQLLFIYLGQKTWGQHCRWQSCLCVSSQLYNIEEKRPAVIYQKYNFLSEYYAYKYLGQINGRWSYIRNNPSFHLKHPGVPDGSDGSDGTWYPLTENYTLPVTLATGRVAYSPPLLCVWYTHHQNDTCATLFAGPAVML
jgi:hypothetical protein